MEGVYRIPVRRNSSLEISQILQEIDAEIARLEQARALLSGTASPAAPKRGRPAGVSNAATVAPATKPAKRVMSAEARERIAAAQRKRWAKQKKAAAKAPAKAAKKPSAKKTTAKAAKPVATKTLEQKTE
jgi:hypothetical protein